MNQRPDYEELEALKSRVTRLEQELYRLEKPREGASEAQRRIEGRRLLENLPLTALIVLLAWIAANWVYKALWS